MADGKKHILRADEIGAGAFVFQHPLGGETSEISMSMMARATGLNQVGVNLGRVPPGKEAFVHHRHQAEEEWVYILSGRALSDIDDRTEEVRQGDFIGYPPGVAHSLRNIGDDDLVYLMGGQQIAVEIADFPRHGKRILSVGDRMEFIDEADCKAFVPDLRPIKND